MVDFEDCYFNALVCSTVCDRQGKGGSINCDLEFGVINTEIGLTVCMKLYWYIFVVCIEGLLNDH